MSAISKILTLSTGHVPEELAVVLDGPLEAWPTNGGKYADIGWFMYCHEEQGDESLKRDFIPDVLFNIMTYARSQGCDYLLFDRDADFIEALPYFDW